MISLVCSPALNEARDDLEDARRAYAEAALTLASARERVCDIVGLAFERQRLGLIDGRLRKEETAYEAFNEAVARLNGAEIAGRRWPKALAYE